MASIIPHITVCICTFKRPHLLNQLLSGLEHQRTESLFTYSVVVVDNDRAGTGRATVESFRKHAGFEVRYHLEPEQNIARARNRAVENSRGEFIAFIDDDEFPNEDWLFRLFQAQRKFNAQGILGPVIPYYDVTPPKWILKGRFHERPDPETGTVLDWSRTRTGNVLLDRTLFLDKENLFGTDYGSGGEDRDFFRRMIGRGSRFVWCREARVFEVVPPERFTRSFMLRRALLRGKIPYNQTIAANLKSLIAVPVYALILPFVVLTHHHVFMKYLVKMFDHIGRLLAFAGIDVVREKYVLK